MSDDYKLGQIMMSNLPPNGFGVVGGFTGLRFIQQLVEENKYFVLGIQNNWKLLFES